MVAVPDKGAARRPPSTSCGSGRRTGSFSRPTPMVRDKALLDVCYGKIADDICALLDAGKNVAFITWGPHGLLHLHLCP